MASFNEEDFLKMQYRVASLPESKTVIERHPKLKSIASWNESLDRLDRDKIHRWIILYFSSDSPLNELDDLNDRLTKAMEYAKLRPGVTKEWPTRLIQAVRGRNPVVNKMIFDYLRATEGISYSVIKTLENQVYNLLIKINEGDTTLVKEVEQIEQKLRERVAKFLNHTENLKLQQDLSVLIAGEEIIMGPEQIAQMMKDGVEVFPEVADISSSFIPEFND